MENRFFNKINGLWLSCLLINIITFCLIFFKIRPQGPSLALHYNVLVGVDVYGKPGEIYAIPIIALTITLINFILYHAIKTKGYVLPALSAFTALIVQFSLLGTALFLMRVN